MSEEKIVEPLYFNGYISLDERANIREYIEKLKKDYDRVVHESTEFESKVYELQDKLQQRDSVIEEAIKLIDDACYIDGTKMPNGLGNKNVRKLLDILNKYKKEEKK